jgi:hypothetical protein
LLSDKEYVINAEQTAKYKPLLDAINYKLDGFADGGMLGYKKGGKHSVSIGKMEQRQAARLAAAAATRTRALSRPEELAALAAQHALTAMRSSALGGIAGGPNRSATGTIVQHTTHIEVNVQGSVTTSRDLAQELAGVIMTYRIPVSLPSGR